jgi:hypothetical protein
MRPDKGARHEWSSMSIFVTDARSVSFARPVEPTIKSGASKRPDTRFHASISAVNKVIERISPGGLAGVENAVCSRSRCWREHRGGGRRGGCVVRALM